MPDSNNNIREYKFFEVLQNIKDRDKIYMFHSQTDMGGIRLTKEILNENFEKDETFRILKQGGAYLVTPRSFIRKRRIEAIEDFKVGHCVDILVKLPIEDSMYDGLHPVQTGTSSTKAELNKDFQGLIRGKAEGIEKILSRYNKEETGTSCQLSNVLLRYITFLDNERLNSKEKKGNDPYLALIKYLQWLVNPTDIKEDKLYGEQKDFREDNLKRTFIAASLIWGLTQKYRSGESFSDDRRIESRYIRDSKKMLEYRSQITLATLVSDISYLKKPHTGPIAEKHSSHEKSHMGKSVGMLKTSVSPFIRTLVTHHHAETTEDIKVDDQPLIKVIATANSLFEALYEREENGKPAPRHINDNFDLDSMLRCISSTERIIDFKKFFSLANVYEILIEKLAKSSTVEKAKSLGLDIIYYAFVRELDTLVTDDPDYLPTTEIILPKEYQLAERFRKRPQSLIFIKDYDPLFNQRMRKLKGLVGLIRKQKA